jgi:hypothetical protein
MKLSPSIALAAVATVLCVHCPLAFAQPGNPAEARANAANDGLEAELARKKASPDFIASLRKSFGGASAPMPSQRPLLDRLLTEGNYADLRVELDKAKTIDDVALNMNWERMQVYSGAPIIVAMLYANDAWRSGLVLPTSRREGLQGTALMMELYVYALLEVDGTRCADPAGPASRLAQHRIVNADVWRFAAGAPHARELAKVLAVYSELATADLRQNDQTICEGVQRDDIDEMAKDLLALGDKPLQPTVKGGSTYIVPRRPASFRDPADWKPKADAIRAKLPEMMDEPFCVA